MGYTVFSLDIHVLHFLFRPVWIFIAAILDRERVKEDNSQTRQRNRYEQACCDVIRKCAFLIVSVNAAIMGKFNLSNKPN